MMHMMPRHGGARIGGAGWQEWFDKTGKQLKAAYNWFLANKSAIHYLLKMKSINPPGYDYASQLEKAMTSVGLGRHGGRHGGAYDEMSMVKSAGPSGPDKFEGLADKYNSLSGPAKTKFEQQNKYALDLAREHGLLGNPSGNDKFQGLADKYNSLSGPAKTKFAQQNKYALDVAREHGLIGNGRHGGASCTCSSGRHGGRVGGRVGGMMSADQMAAAARAAMEQVKAKARSVEGKVIPHVQTMVAKAQALEQKARAKVGGMHGGMYGGMYGGVYGGVHGGRVGGRVGGRAPSARGAIVKKVMAEHGLSLPQASKYVKEHGLY
jgi:hypothetical protein